MHRNLLVDLQKWSQADDRKPLILRGARQVGKTWVVRKLAELVDYQLVELNFERQTELAKLFESNKPQEIILNLEAQLGIEININRALLFLDEIQVVPELLAKLRWFYESMPQLAVIATGSLLDFALEQHEFSMPVGRVNYYFMEPLGFEEFLLAKAEDKLLEAIKKFDFTQSFNQVLHDKAQSLFREYMIVGGMPAAVASWIKTQSFSTLAQTHNDLINTYKDDFNKYLTRLDHEHLQRVFIAIPKMLGKKFVYSKVDKDTAHKSIKLALTLLTSARLCHPTQCVAANGIPIEAEIKANTFKMIFLDIGLVSALLGLRLYQFDSFDEILLFNKGALAEQVVGQLLRLSPPSYIDPKLFYWIRQTSASAAEVDYVVQHNQTIIPIEVKAGAAGKLQSLHQFMSERPTFNKAVRVYAGEPMIERVKVKTTQGKPVDYQLVSLPFYLLSRLVEFV